ncbi:tRNA (guanosine(37)-N1)-methyltransferase TrmD [Lapidilactobacillus gannanensis]|jgi:tRNA (guanine37-N1)-methyltransferase|uniref:tRNA (guanine-N(1)-)-methyltransferase n=1 Tax=Lapidilactobacillus gannanensis TaxID=2486002 RepID=A0ABW4BNW2_9LACO|nr:tRNA (guanosine(37)-N1)-methyltransferase TrmD [Lapidilactobacillus gannanensis]MCH4058085.1 tRNA (guanosine(37)-N1)-methyltransferase TrmD [Lactobacillaceae bacterium]
MQIDILSLFPEMFGALQASLIGRAQENGILKIDVTNFRDFTTNKQHHVDDTPYGGGAGMLLQVQPIAAALNDVTAKHGPSDRTIILDPGGRQFDHAYAVELAQCQHLTFICGHYEGFDQRVYDLATDQVSLGDYVVTGGELPAMVMIDALARQIPGVLGKQESAATDSFAQGLLEYPQYTRPADYQGQTVPFVLTNGNHPLIAEWRLKAAVWRTLKERPDLLEKITDPTIQKLVRQLNQRDDLSSFNDL